MIKVGMKLVKCIRSEPGMNAQVVMGDIFTVLEIPARGIHRRHVVRVHSKRLNRILLMYTDKHFVREDGTYNIYRPCVWEAT